jgi:predicted NBD/HSP70 family sugar kinase
LNPSYGLFVGADIGVGRINISALDMAANVVSKTECRFDTTDASPDHVIGLLVEQVKLLKESLSGRYQLRGLCVTAPGVIDRNGMILRAPILGWRQEPVLEKLQERLPDIPLLVAENDANALAIAEMYQARNDSTDTEIYIYLDAGVGGAIVTNGQLLRGEDGYAGELGHIILGDEGFVELATIPGSFESFIGREAVLARYRFHGGSAVDIASFVNFAIANERAANSTLNDWSFYLGRAIATLTSIFNPTRLVLGGPVASLYELCREQTAQNIRRSLLDGHPIPEIRVSLLGREGPAIGGASMLHRKMLSFDENIVYRGAKGDIAR